MRTAILLLGTAAVLAVALSARRARAVALIPDDLPPEDWSTGWPDFSSFQAFGGAGGYEAPSEPEFAPYAPVADVVAYPNPPALAPRQAQPAAAGIDWSDWWGGSEQFSTAPAEEVAATYAADAAENPMFDWPQVEAEAFNVSLNDQFEDGTDNLDKIRAKLRAERGPWPNVDEFEPFVQEAAGQFGVRPAIIRAVIYHESRYRPDAMNPTSSATGLMQMLLGTARDFGLGKETFFAKGRTRAKELLDPRAAIHAGAAMLAQTIAEFGERDGVRAYYAGPTAIRNQVRQGVMSAHLAGADRYAERVFANV